LKHNKNRILLIDDEPGWCTLLKSELQENGFDIEYETNAKNALEAVSSFNPDAVLLDVLFGDTNKGKSIFKRIKNSYPDLTVIMLSSSVADEEFMLEDYPGCAFAFAKSQLNSGKDSVYREFTENIKRIVFIANLPRTSSVLLIMQTRLQIRCKRSFHLLPVRPRQ